jgi:STIP1 family protein 1
VVWSERTKSSLIVSSPPLCPARPSPSSKRATSKCTCHPSTPPKIPTLTQPSARKFAAGDYKAAEQLYSQAIVHDSLNAQLFTNRAFTRLKLLAYNDALSDCLKAIDINSTSMKAYYYLAQAQLALRHPNEALSSALTAYDLSLSVGTMGDISSISALVLRAKREKWDAREKERLRARSELLAELEDRLDMATRAENESIETRMSRAELTQHEAETEMQLLRGISRRKVEELRSLFAVADPKNMAKRVCQDSFLCAHYLSVPRLMRSVGGARLPGGQHLVLCDA